MRKALTLSALALASSMALGGATTAFAADAPAPQTDPGSSSSPSASPRTDHAGLTLSTASAEPGDTVRFQMDVPDGSTHLSVSSEALDGVRMTDGRGGAAKVAAVGAGTYGVSLTGTGPDGAKLRATAQLTVTAAKPAPTPTPAPGDATVNLSTDFGRPGDRVVVTVKTSAKDAWVTSDAFGGRVDLKNDGKGAFTGTAIVAKDVKTGYYGVWAFAGGKQFDTVRFSTEGKSAPAVTPKPLKPSEHKTPKGSVNTGEAPVGHAAETLLEPHRA
ncbi:hypothetical protein [Streptomyces sp. NPDC091268]|uniref:hypothetical protein n=1 Tax=Streptomyces sp. NPDC091268 TaxID=3365979 RepID=UPI0037F1B4D2